MSYYEYYALIHDSPFSIHEERCMQRNENKIYINCYFYGFYKTVEELKPFTEELRRRFIHHETTSTPSNETTSNPSNETTYSRPTLERSQSCLNRLDSLDTTVSIYTNSDK